MPISQLYIIFVQMGSLTIKVLHTPCHTTDHVCYYVTEGKRSSVLFSGW